MRFRSMNIRVGTVLVLSWRFAGHADQDVKAAGRSVEKRTLSSTPPCEVVKVTSVGTVRALVKMQPRLSCV